MRFICFILYGFSLARGAEPIPILDSKIPVITPSPDGQLMIRYQRKAYDPNAGQDGSIYLVVAADSTKPLLTFFDNTTGVHSALAEWRPDSAAALVILQYVKEAILLIAEKTPTGWVLYRDPVIPTEIKYLGPKISTVSAEQIKFNAWLPDGSLSMLDKLTFHGGMTQIFSYIVTFPGGIIKQWTPIPTLSDRY